MSEREMIDHETQRGERWKVRAQAAEQWWSQAAPLLAQIGRKHTLDAETNTKLRALMAWEPN
jgi:hypothetical protein